MLVSEKDLPPKKPNFCKIIFSSLTTPDYKAKNCATGLLHPHPQPMPAGFSSCTRLSPPCGPRVPDPHNTCFSLFFSPFKLIFGLGLPIQRVSSAGFSP